MSEWISVKEKLPEKNERVLAMSSDKEIELLSFSKGKFWIEDSYSHEDAQGNNIFTREAYYIEKWIPLPSPPENK